MTFYLDYSNPDRPFVWAEHHPNHNAWIDGKQEIDKLNAFEKQSLTRKTCPDQTKALVWYTSLWPFEFQ